VTPGACHVVVGAGPTGFTAACELARRGATVRIIDRAPEPSPATKALGVQPRTLELLDRLDWPLPYDQLSVFLQRGDFIRLGLTTAGGRFAPDPAAAGTTASRAADSRPRCPVRVPTTRDTRTPGRRAWLMLDGSVRPVESCQLRLLCSGFSRGRCVYSCEASRG
jgi:choline dehydrogenase-like flavoprotein